MTSRSRRSKKKEHKVIEMSKFLCLTCGKEKEIITRAGWFFAGDEEICLRCWTDRKEEKPFIKSIPFKF